MEKLPCEICGRRSEHTHHVFYGPLRKWSEKYKLTMRLCRECHEMIHKDAAICVRYKMKYQKKFEDQYGHELWMKVFGRNYL